MSHNDFTLWEVNMAHISLKSPRKIGLVGNIVIDKPWLFWIYSSYTKNVHVHVPGI